MGGRPELGHRFLPRVGSEVLVEFLHGDIDQPRITGQLYNGEVAPPFGGGIDENARHPGVLSGLHTQAHDGSGTQQWVMDDTPGSCAPACTARWPTAGWNWAT
jgi:uncharacterized protein involved in type VI secretion and phage assembly